MLDESAWLAYQSSIIAGALQIYKSMKDGIDVVIHCSDGWDRTSQLCCLTQIMFDPYYRTIEGFIVLIEKDWINFGHQFGIRSGVLLKQGHEEQRAPIFLQFLDSVYQLLKQFPISFEYNKLFLLEIIPHIYSNQFGTFLCNNYQ